MSVNIICQYFNTENLARQAELDFCVRQNLAHPQVSKVFNLAEAGTTIPQDILEHPKHQVIYIENWLTYRQAFDFARENIPIEEICCLCNLDIFLDYETNWDNALNLLNDRVVLCLSRHEYDGVNPPYLDNRHTLTMMARTQDAWVFRSDIKVSNCDFSLGTWACDNAIAHRIKSSDYKPLNMMMTYKIFHYDQCRNAESLPQRYQSQNDQKVQIYPNNEGFLLLPAYEAVIEASIDELLNLFHAPNTVKYSLLCDFYSNYIRAGNIEES